MSAQSPAAAAVLKRSQANKRIALLNINGVYYRSTGHKLQKHVVEAPISPRRQTTKSTKPPGHRRPTQQKSGLRIKIRGTQFMLEANGKKLRRISENTAVAAAAFDSPQPSLSRFDLGRITYIADSSKTTWVRTDRHKTRAHLSGAKQKSIQVLAKNLVKSNVPCAIYQRLGRCLRRDRDRCNHIHDPKRVAICQK